MVVTWTVLKAFADSRSASLQFVDLGDSYCVAGIDGPWRLDCTLAKDGGSDVTEFETDYKTPGNKSPISATQTMREVKYLRLQGVRLVGAADGAGICSVTVEVPSPSRYIDWGEAWISGDSHPDDMITAIDVEAPVGPGGSWVKVSGYLDDEATEAGWALPMKPEIAEVEPLGWYGLLPYGTRLKITAQCGGTAFTGRTLYCNLGWGKDDTA
jgi:hypothetical protein